MSDDSTASLTEESAGSSLDIVVIEEDQPRRYALPTPGALVLGRSDDAEVRVEAAPVSRRHARFFVEQDAVFVEDLESQNGTRVGGVALAPRTPRKLEVGDVVECASVLIVVRRRTETAARRSMLVATDARWFRRGADVVTLGRRGPLRLVLAALVDRRMHAAGIALSVPETLAAGWPDERMTQASGQARVYTTVQRLRALGVGDLLITRGDGYLLDPDADIERG